jgi:Polyketide cyclase / dehydrase and lipid transport
MTCSFERIVDIVASPGEVFARLDDQTRLAAHMEQASPMMGGGRMTYEFDEGRGQAVGSHIKMGGSAFGISLHVDEVVTERSSPSHKAWKTTGPTRLLIISEYEMGFEIRAEGAGSKLRVWITYELPAGLVGRLFGLALAPMYARWCVNRIATDAATYFSSLAQPSENAAMQPTSP